MTRRNQRDFRNSLPFLINRVGTALAQHFADAALAEPGLTIPIWRVLATLGSEGELRQTDLASLTSIEASTLSRVITRMIRQGLVERTRSTKSDREVSVRLLPKGRAIVDRLAPLAVGHEARAVAGLAAADLEVVRRCLRHMHQNIVQAAPRPARKT